MLYHYASLDQLKRVYAVVTHMIEGVVNPLLDTAAVQQRDSLLRNSRWGDRNTSENWSNYGWPFLKDMQASLAKNIARRAFDIYDITHVGEYLRGAEQYSMQWATEAEEEQYRQAAELINSIATPIDKTLYPRAKPQWNDFAFYVRFNAFKTDCPSIPKFRVRTDLLGVTGQIPPRTGVYISADDPNATLQFASTGNDGIKLRDASTFSEIGLEALAAVGRNDFWFNEQKMLDYVLNSKHYALFRGTVEENGKTFAVHAPLAVAKHASVTRPSTWYFVEIVEEDFEATDFPLEASAKNALQIRLRGGETCRQAGYYFSPAHVNSRRHFQSEQQMPVFDAQYGDTIWQWDQNQN